MKMISIDPSGCVESASVIVGTRQRLDNEIAVLYKVVISVDNIGLKLIVNPAGSVIFARPVRRIQFIAVELIVPYKIVALGRLDVGIFDRRQRCRCGCLCSLGNFGFSLSCFSLGGCRLCDRSFSLRGSRLGSSCLGFLSACAHRHGCCHHKRCVSDRFLHIKPP